MKNAKTVIWFDISKLFSIVYMLFIGFNLSAQDAGTLSDPGSLTAYRGKNGQTFSFRVTGTDAGSVWGGANGIYTDDSRLGKAAVHAGLLKNGQEGVITVTIMPGQTSYSGNNQNGITTTNYGSWQGSFRFASAPVSVVSTTTTTQNDPGNVAAYRGKNEQSFSFRVTGTDAGSAWGGSNGVYTDDSRLGKAAVHAGILKVGQEGTITIIIMPGQSSYGGNNQNGISTANYGGWQGSFRFASTPVSVETTTNSTQSDPGNLAAFRGKNEQSFSFRVTGTDAGSVWGGSNGVYTDDSRLGKAAVHAGLLKAGQEGVITIIIMSGQASYGGNSQNGITTTNYGSWQGSFRFASTLVNTTYQVANPAQNDPGNLASYRAKNGQSFRFRATGTEAGSVWGGANGIYTDDSRLGKAAVHAGKLKIGQEGEITITILPGQASYTGNTQHGITTTNYGSWQGSFKFE